MIQTVLVTGGTGFIGSHTCVELLNAGLDVVCVDNLCNSKSIVIDRIKEITGKEISFYKSDVCDPPALRRVFDEHSIDAVIHFAGLKAVGESVEKPLLYYRNNLNSTITLLDCMTEYGVKKIVFSSSATVYGVPKAVPIDENAETWCTNPYGWTKYMSEQIIKDWCNATSDASAMLLRYFNPIGAHENGLIGEDPNGIPNNLMPYIAQVAVGKLSRLRVFGNDYPTPDGTGVRDYIHVVDLAKGHVAALNKLSDGAGLFTYNLGTGVGYSVLDVLHAFEKACGKTLAYEIVARRPGDVAACYADPEKAARELGWRAEFGIERMCADTWRWQSQNPNGYGEA